MEGERGGDEGGGTRRRGRQSAAAEGRDFGEDDEGVGSVVSERGTERSTDAGFLLESVITERDRSGCERK